MKFNKTRKGLLLRGASMLLVLIACSFVSAQEPKLTGTWVYTNTTTSLTLRLNEDGSATLQGKSFATRTRQPVVMVR